MKHDTNLNLIDQMSAPEQEPVTGVTESANLQTRADSSQPSSGDAVSNNFQIPENVKGTVLTEGYYLAVLCLCWLLRNWKDFEPKFQKIKNVAKLKKRNDIFKCLKDIREGNDRGKLLLRRMQDINPILLAAGISAINRLKSEGKITPHHFRPARHFDSFRLQVPIKEVDMEQRTFNKYDYKILLRFYSEEDGSFNISNAITSLFTDIVLSCFKDCTPNLHIVTSGSKWTFADLIDVGELMVRDSYKKLRKVKQEYDKLYLIGVEICARSAAFLLKWHKFFKRLYLNDADLRFYNYLKCVKEYPLYLITEILFCNRNEELNKLRDDAYKEAMERKQAEDRGESSRKSKDSSLVKIRDFLAGQCNAFSDSVRDRVRAAAWLFLWVNMSFSGNFDSSISKDRLYLKDLYKKLSEMLSAALVLQKAEISCMDCIDFAKRFIAYPSCFIFADPPYVEIFGSACKTYSIKLPKDFTPSNGRKIVKKLNPFGIDKIKELFPLLAQAKGKVLITHSDEHEVNLAAYCVGLNYLFSYYNKANGSDKDAYETIVYSKNINEDGFILRNKENGKPQDPAFIDEWRLSRYTRRAEWLRQKKADDVDLTEDFANACADQTSYKGEGK